MLLLFQFLQGRYDESCFPGKETGSGRRDTVEVTGLEGQSWNLSLISEAGFSPLHGCGFDSWPSCSPLFALCSLGSCVPVSFLSPLSLSSCFHWTPYICCISFPYKCSLNESQSATVVASEVYSQTGGRVPREAQCGRHLVATAGGAGGSGAVRDVVSHQL